LRLIIILIGVVFIAAVYLLSRQRRKLRAGIRRNAPSLGDEEGTVLSESATLETSPAPVAHATASGAEARQLILALHVTCAESAGFDGAQVLNALQTNGLHYGQHQVYHRLIGSGPESSVFSVANLVEPGVLPPGDLPQRRIPGLTLFLVLPGPQDGVAACADMLATARALARQLGGSVQDDQRQLLTPQSAQHIRQRILEFQYPTAIPPG
jgi:cell division protein ZipA